MKKVARILLLSIIVMAAAVITITACGGNRPGGTGGGGTALRAFVFNSNPLGFHVTRGFGPSRASIAPFTVNAQTASIRLFLSDSVMKSGVWSAQAFMLTK